MASQVWRSNSETDTWNNEPMPACLKMQTDQHTEHRCSFVPELSGGQWAASWFFTLKTRQFCSRTRTRACSRCGPTLRPGGCWMWGKEWLYFRRPSLIFMRRINSVGSWVGTPAMESSLWAAAAWPGLHASHPLQWPFLLPLPPRLCCSIFKLHPQFSGHTVYCLTWSTPTGWLQSTVCTLKL